MEADSCVALSLHAGTCAASALRLSFTMILQTHVCLTLSENESDSCRSIRPRLAGRFRVNDWQLFAYSVHTTTSPNLTQDGSVSESVFVYDPGSRTCSARVYADHMFSLHLTCLSGPGTRCQSTACALTCMRDLPFLSKGGGGGVERQTSLSQ